MLGNLLGGAAGGNQQQQSAWDLQEREFDENRFMERVVNSNDKIDLSPSGFQIVGEIKVGADQKMEFGHGDVTLDPMEQGRPKVITKDDATSPVTWKGDYRFLHVSSQEGKVIKISDISSESLNQSTRSERITMPRASRPARPGQGKPAAGQDDFIRVKLNPSNHSSTSGKVSMANSDWKVPVTVHERN